MGCLDQCRCALINLGRQGQYQKVPGVALQAVNVFPVAGNQQGITGFQYLVNQQTVQCFAVASQTDHVQLAPRAETQLLDGLVDQAGVRWQHHFGQTQ